MKKVIWVYENVKKSIEGYSRLNVLSLIASVSTWDKFNPNTFKVLYCDEMTHDLIKNIGIEQIFDEILPIPENNGINSEIFWASSKLRVLEKVNEPIVLMDHDFFVFCNMEEYLGDSLLYSFEEVIKRNSYPSLNNKHIVNLPFKIPRHEKTACNVSFLYLPNNEFTNKYASLSLKMMESFSTLDKNEMNSGILIKEGSVLALPNGIVNEELKNFFRPEFLNRVDDIIIFDELSKEDIAEIVKIELRKLEDRVNALGYKFRINQKSIEFLCINFIFTYIIFFFDDI